MINAMELTLFNRLLNKIAFLSPGGSSLRPLLQRMRGVTIGQNVWLSQYVYMDELHPEGIIIGDNVTIGLRSSIITHFYWGQRKSEGGYKKVIIEEDCFVGPHCLILPGVKIGRCSVIKGGTTVTRNVPPNTLWGFADAGSLATVTVPLTSNYSYSEFVRGIRPKRKPNNRMKK
jgi:acetyltransferase-like isoleucine patch superfamily enzyme